MWIVDERGRPVEVNDSRQTIYGAGERLMIALERRDETPEAWLNGRALTWDASANAFRAALPPGRSRIRVSHPPDERWLTIEMAPDDGQRVAQRWSALLADLERWIPSEAMRVDQARWARSTVALLPIWRRAVRAVAGKPRGLLQESVYYTPADRIQRADRRLSRWLERHPGDYRAVMEADTSVYLPQRTATATMDHPANRYAAYLVARVTRALGTMAEQLRQHTHGSSRGNAGLIEWTLEDLEVVWRSSFLSRVSPAPLASGVLSVVLDDPLYARIHSYARRLVAPQAVVDAKAVSKALPEPHKAPGLYEVWAFMAVAHALEKLLPGWRWAWRGHLSAFDAHKTTVQVEGRRGDQALVLSLRPHFVPEWSKEDFPRRDLWGGGGPSLALVAWNDSDRHQGRWISIDVDDDRSVGSAEARKRVHAHRDGLWWEGAGGRPVLGIWLAADPGEELMGWGGQRFVERYGVGAFRMEPGAVMAHRIVASWIRALGVG